MSDVFSNFIINNSLLKIRISKNSTLEQIASQLQIHSPHLLCVINNLQLTYFEKLEDLPTNLRFNHKLHREKLNEYYFRSISDDTLYCVFGRVAAKVLYPRLDAVDPSGIIETVPVSLSLTRKDKERNPIVRKLESEFSKPSASDLGDLLEEPIDDNEIKILDKGQEIVFPVRKYPLSIQRYTNSN